MPRGAPRRCPCRSPAGSGQRAAPLPLPVALDGACSAATPKFPLPRRGEAPAAGRGRCRPAGPGGRRGRPPRPLPAAGRWRRDRAGSGGAPLPSRACCRRRLLLVWGRPARGGRFPRAARGVPRVAPGRGGGGSSRYGSWRSVASVAPRSPGGTRPPSRPAGGTPSSVLGGGGGEAGAWVEGANGAEGPV